MDTFLLYIGKDSTKALGHLIPDPKADKTLEDGVVVPLGKQKDAGLKNYSSMLHNEYIVYHTDQVCNRFLLKVKFHFK
jgi:poly [ADP-ribose] polymerase